MLARRQSRPGDRVLRNRPQLPCRAPARATQAGPIAGRRIADRSGSGAASPGGAEDKPRAATWTTSPSGSTASMRRRSARSFAAARRRSRARCRERYGAEGYGPSLYITDPDGNTVELKGRRRAGYSRKNCFSVSRRDALAPLLRQEEMPCLVIAHHLNRQSASSSSRRSWKDHFDLGADPGPRRRVRRGAGPGRGTAVVEGRRLPPVQRHPQQPADEVPAGQGRLPVSGADQSRQRADPRSAGPAGRLRARQPPGHPPGSSTAASPSIANSFQGRRLNRPNDVVVKSDGCIYFTDPWTSPAAPEQWDLDFPASTGSRPISAR